MKMVASVLALVLIGFTGGWLWIDAAADAQETEGIVVPGALEPGEALSPSSPGVPGATGGQLLGAVQEGTSRLSEGFAQAREEAEQEAKDKKAAEKAAKAEAEEKAAAERRAEEEAEAQQAAEEAARAAVPSPAPPAPAQPGPVQPAPVQPVPVMCWDDDEWEECDDGTSGHGSSDDDWDDSSDDDWDDD